MERKARSDLKQMLVDETAEPMALPLSLLVDITGGFSDDQEIGIGGHSVVYKGILGDRAVAVKKLTDAFMDETIFHREVECLMRVKKNKYVVRFLGYCAERQGSMERYNRKRVIAAVHQRFLCFEYIRKGSLDKYIIDPHREWGLCYKIIKGICVGLQSLHDNCIVHLDLKPTNILLDDNMAPKITDFGLSRCFNETQSRDITENILGTIGYLAPELHVGGEITRSADLYSLGVTILEILTGHKGHQAIGDVLQSWSDRLDISQRDTLCEQIQVCYDIALECRNINPKKRPASARDIIVRLHEMESIQNSDKDGGGSEQKKNPDKGGGGGKHKKNPDKGGGDSKQKRNPDKSGGGGEQKKNPDKGGRGGKQKKNPEKGGGANKGEKAGSQSQPKEDKQKQPWEETIPIEETTVLLRICLHCNGCIDGIKRLIYSVKGVKNVVVEDFAKDEVKVVGTVDIAAMVVYLWEKSSLRVEVVGPGKKDDKMDKGGSSGDSNKEQKDKAVEVAAAGRGEHAPRVSMAPGPVGVSMHHVSPYGSLAYPQTGPQGPPPSYYNYYGGGNADGVPYANYYCGSYYQHPSPQRYANYYCGSYYQHPSPQPYPPQMFSDKDKGGSGDGEKKRKDRAAGAGDVHKDKGKVIEVAGPSMAPGKKDEKDKGGSSNSKKQKDEAAAVRDVHKDRGKGIEVAGPSIAPAPAPEMVLAYPCGPTYGSFLYHNSSIYYFSDENPNGCSVM